jgi:hypothetical protein
MPSTLSGEEIMRRLARLLAVLAIAVVATQATAAPRDRIPTRAERDAVIVYTLPVAATALLARCSPVLDEDGYLRTHGTALLARMTTEQEAAWPLARRGVTEIPGSSYRPAGANPSDAEWRAAYDRYFADEIAQLSVNQCREIEAIIEPLDPLPYANLVQALSAIATIAVETRTRRSRATLQNAEP